MPRPKLSRGESSVSIGFVEPGSRAFTLCSGDRRGSRRMFFGNNRSHLCTKIMQGWSVHMKRRKECVCPERLMESRSST